jgi:hypothetical protein
VCASVSVARHLSRQKQRIEWASEWMSAGCGSPLLRANKQHAPTTTLPATVSCSAAAAAAVSRPSAVFGEPDPNVFQLVPPFPLEEDFITVNGIK